MKNGERFLAVARVYGADSDSPVHAYRAMVRHLVSGWPKIHAGPVSVRLSFHFPRPARITWKTRPNPAVWHDVGADLDNLAKSTLDAMSGKAFTDDRQVARLVLEKHYCAAGCQSGVWIEVEKLQR